MQHTYTVTFSRNVVVVLLLILVPISVVALFVVPMLSFPSLPDWVALTLSMVAMAAAIAVMLFVYRKWAALRAEVVMDDQGITVSLLERSPFYRRRSYSSSWEGLENVSTNYDVQHNKRFYLISFKQPHTTISLMVMEDTDADNETPFGETLMGYVSRYNSAHQSQPETQIRRRGFYDSGWAVALTVFAYAAMLAVIVMRIMDPEKVGMWRVLQVMTFGGMWVATYHVNRRKKER